MGIGLRYRRALDFGCGVGRLTHALAKYFEEVCGVDLAPSMIRLANQYNRYPSRCKFYLNDQLDLQLFTGRSFDFIYTIITLQHMKPEYAKTYLKEFLRLLAPHGILVFQMPSERLCQPNLSLKIKKFATAVVPQAVLERLKLARHSTGAIYSIERGEIQRLLVDNKAEILSTVRDDKPGPSWISYTYFVMKLEQNGDEPSSHISS
jgi:ubiquinone/menaquinone biosynthesis C-methylase UbiE